MHRISFVLSTVKSLLRKATLIARPTVPRSPPGALAGIGMILGMTVMGWGSHAGAETPAPVIQRPHPLDPALKVARDSLTRLDRDVRDYTCTIVKRERVNGQLGDYQYMFAKIRHQQEDQGESVPFGVYLKFLKPKAVEGREVIWVNGRNDGKLCAHETGLLNVKRVWLDPTSYLAMLGQRYPITEIGIRKLIEQLLAKGERDKQHDGCEVKFFEGAKVNGRVCRLIQVTHPTRRPNLDFHKAQIFMDEELNLPIRYAAWVWPDTPDGEPVLEEEYTYLDVKLNVGLTDADFDPSNKDYNFPRL